MVEQIFGLTPEVIQAANQLGEGYIGYLYHRLYIGYGFLILLSVIGTFGFIKAVKLVMEEYKEKVFHK